MSDSVPDDGEAAFRAELTRLSSVRGMTTKVMLRETSKRFSVSRRTLQRRLKTYGLQKKQKRTATAQEVQTIIEDRQHCTVRGFGYRATHEHILAQLPCKLPRRVVAAKLHELNPRASICRRDKSLKPRIYRNAGPNAVWHVDQYDKLWRWGFPIHACIDGHSRFLIWLKVIPSNNDPIVIVDLYLKAVLALGACPEAIRTDRGTENVYMAAAQRAFRLFQTDEETAKRSHRWGTSPTNSRIESSWSRLRRSGVSEYWIQNFQLLYDQGFLDPDDYLNKCLIRFIVLRLLEQELNHWRIYWNNHAIRKNKNSVYSVPGRPVMLYSYTDPTKFRECKQHVSNEQVAEMRAAACPAYMLDSLLQWMTQDEYNKVNGIVKAYRLQKGISLTEEITMRNWTEYFYGTVHLIQMNNGIPLIIDDNDDHYNDEEFDDFLDSDEEVDSNDGDADDIY